MEFGGYLLNVAKNTTRARARKGEAQGVLSYQKATGIFDNPHIYRLWFQIHPIIDSLGILLSLSKSGLWFQILFIFTPTWGNDPI